MTIFEIAEKVERGETVEIQPGCLRELQEQAKAHLTQSICWDIVVIPYRIIIKKAHT